MTVQYRMPMGACGYAVLPHTWTSEIMYYYYQDGHIVKLHINTCVLPQSFTYAFYHAIQQNNFLNESIVSIQPSFFTLA